MEKLRLKKTAKAFITLIILVRIDAFKIFQLILDMRLIIH